eukprot:Hpha_TRINITY_DN13376_c0_g1::TRINITY_DN13376_c0_g1_i2::g.95726::m.95726
MLYGVCSDAKGSFMGARGSGNMLSERMHNRAYGVYMGRGFHYRTVGGHYYSPRYGGGWNNTPGWDGKGGCGTCPCPMPQPLQTKVWVWVQVRVEHGLCAECRGVDVSTMEVDTFKDIASRTPCSPPTQVLVLRVCNVSIVDTLEVGLDDSELLSHCVVVGDEATQHAALRLRRLLQSHTQYVVQYVVGAKDQTHAEELEEPIELSMQSGSRLADVYHISGVLSIETEGEGWLATIEEAFGRLLLPIFILVCIVYLLRRRFAATRPQQRRQQWGT